MQTNVDTCQLCDRRGHIALNCRRRFDIHFRNTSNSLSNQFNYSMNHQAYAANVASSANSVADSTWYPDSGANNHMTPDVGLLRTPVAYNGSEKVQIGSGEGLSISHIGQSKLQSFNLHNILHVPCLTKNLLSVSQFTKDNSVFLLIFE